jgi:hypothetical protein
MIQCSVPLVEQASYPAAVVRSEKGRVLWHRSSPGFVRWVRKGRLNEKSVAARHFRRKPFPKEPEAVPAAAWLLEKRLKPGVRLWESAVALPAYDAVLSLLVLREVVTEAE